MEQPLLEKQSTLKAEKPGGSEAARPERYRVLVLSFIGFTIMFGAWTMFGVLGLPIRTEFGLSDVQLAWLTAVAILNGSIWRLPLGVLTDMYGGKIVFTLNLLITGISAFLVVTATSYTQLLVFAFLVGFAGNSFSVGSAWCATWFPKHQQGFAMGLFGAGNVGASITKFIGPALIVLVPAPILGGAIPGGWRFVPFVYGVIIMLMTIILWFSAPKHDAIPGKNRAFSEMFAPLKDIRVWRFSLYYIVVFGAYVAMSVWLPKYYVDVYGLPLATAALVTTSFILASSLLRPFGGILSDKYGPRKITYIVFIVGALASLILFFPLNLYAFMGMVLVIGIAQGIGKASTIKYIPDYYPKDVGVVVGLVGALAALGGFFMPPLFAYLAKWSGQPQSMFWVLFGITVISLIWLHLVVIKMNKEEKQAI